MAAAHQDELVESSTNARDVQAQKPNEDRVSMQHLEHDVPTRTPRLTTQSIIAVIVGLRAPFSSLSQLIVL